MDRPQQWNIRFSIMRGTADTVLIVVGNDLKQTGERSVEVDGVQLHFMEAIKSIETFDEFVRREEQGKKGREVK